MPRGRALRVHCASMTRSRRRTMRTKQAFLGAFLLGLVVPIGLVTVGPIMLGERGLYVSFGFAFAAYTAHAFLLIRFAHSRRRWAAFAVTLLLGSTYGLW